MGRVSGNLYPPQATCIEKGLLDGRNLLVAIPTASGKTLIAEMTMHRHIAAGGKCLYIVPLKALASEKYDEFGNKGVRVGISTGDLDRRDDALGRNDIIVATSEKVDSLLRNSARWMPEITLVVVDEVHLIDSPDRGPTLKMVIAKMRSRNPGMQLIGLSATIGNPKMLAGWLDAELVTSSWRPVDLRQGVFYDNRIQFEEGTRPIKQVSKNYDDLNLCLDTIAEGGQCLVFVSSRRNAEAFAKRAAGAIKSENPALARVCRPLASRNADRDDKNPRRVRRKRRGVPPCRPEPERTLHRGRSVPQRLAQVHLLHTDPCCGPQPARPPGDHPGLPPVLRR